MAEVRLCVNDRGEARASCYRAGSMALLKSLRQRFPEHRFKPATCMGLCAAGPAICHIDDNGRETTLSEGDVEALEQLLHGH